MSNIAEHYTEEEGEGDHSEEGRVDLTVGWDAVSVNDLLEHPGDFINFEESGWL